MVHVCVRCVMCFVQEMLSIAVRDCDFNLMIEVMVVAGSEDNTNLLTPNH
jgi:hypothetical protein